MPDPFDQHSASDPVLRNDDSGLFFSPQPPPQPAQRTDDARNPDSVLFDLAKVAVAVGPTPRAAARSHDASGSGLIDVRALGEVANDTVARRPPTLTLLPSLVPQVQEVAVVSVEAPSQRPLLYAILGLMLGCGVLLGYVAMT